MQEIWKDIKGYEGLYQISNLGRVKSLRKWIRGYNGYKNEERILKPYIHHGPDYYVVTLCKNKNKKMHLLHRLIAKAFIPNPNNYPQINHIDGNKQNNNITNLEWCTQSQNTKHAFKMGLEKPNRYMLYKKDRISPLCKKVIQYDKNGNIITKFKSCAEATRITKINHISDCCRGKVKTAGGFIWKYSE